MNDTFTRMVNLAETFLDGRKYGDYASDGMVQHFWYEAFKALADGFAQRLPILLKPLAEVWEKKLRGEEVGALVEFDAKGCYDLLQAINQWKGE